MRSRLLVSVVITCAVYTCTAASGRSAILVEGENFIDYEDIAMVPIQAVPGPSCSGGYMVIGLDYPSEWTKYNVPVENEEYGYYVARMLCRGDLGVSYQIRLEIYPPNIGMPQTIEFNYSGKGYG
ncbi:MAG: hypothetical protein JSV33_12025 [bacterium]|nr:MAG: hypothetical protein JSV33_12025 [bacterium]